MEATGPVRQDSRRPARHRRTTVALAMRIMMVNNFGYVTGGADRHYLGLADRLQHRGHETSFVTTSSERNLVTRGSFVPLLVTHAIRDALPLHRRAQVAAAALWNRAAARSTAEVIADFKPDVVHLHKLYPQLSVAPVVVARRLGVPTVQTLHDYEFLAASSLDASGRRYDVDEERLSYRSLNTATYAIRRRVHAPRIDRWVAVSRFVADRYRQHGISATVLPNFAPRAPDIIPGYEERDGVVFIGKFTEYKGLPDVLELAALRPDLLVTVAGDGALEPRVRTASAELTNLRYMSFLEAEAVHELLRSARVAVMPSHWEEPGGVAALEAMSVGTPVVVYPKGGMPEYVGEAEAGAVVDESPEALARACSTLVSDREAWEARSRAAVVAVRSTFSLDHYVDQIEAIYENVQAATDRQAEAGN